ncbi:MAG TPA: Fe-S cluster assembly protein SufB, partial [Lachnoclostridium sp.]|nr:Fe-S cluster assembly protein SufB [Lachnoclostridium sp.]
MERKKTQVAEINRDAYDIANPENASYKVDKGLTAEIVTDISKGKNEPRWM